MPFRDRKTGAEIRPFGYALDGRGGPIRRTVDTSDTRDHGADPIGDGRFRMVPSGDIVDWAERCRRLDADR